MDTSKNACAILSFLCIGLGGVTRDVNEHQSPCPRILPSRAQDDLLRASGSSPDSHNFHRGGVRFRYRRQRQLVLISRFSKHVGAFRLTRTRSTTAFSAAELQSMIT